MAVNEVILKWNAGKNLIRIIFIFCAIIFISTSCSNRGTPKPRGYFRIEFPEKEYVRLDSVMPYSILYPKYSRIETDLSSKSEPHWINVEFPRFNATIHITYKNLESEDIYEILEDIVRLSFSHTVKADAIEEHIYIDDEYDVFGIVFEVKGNAASPLQFFATDSVKHLIRGSLYFNTVPNRDSLSPVIDFLTEDVFLLMENIRWKY